MNSLANHETKGMNSKTVNLSVRNSYDTRKLAKEFLEKS